MSLKRKVTATTLAASLAVTAFAGIPLSSKGLAQKLGFNNVASAASVGSISYGVYSVTDIVYGVKGILDNANKTAPYSVAEKVYLDSVNSVVYVTYDDGGKGYFDDIFAPVKGKITIGGAPISGQDSANVDILTAALIKLAFGLDEHPILALDNDADVLATLTKLEAESGLDLTKEELYGLLYGTNGLITLINNQLNATGGVPTAGYTALLESVFADFVANNEGLDAFGITAADLKQAFLGFREAVGTQLFDQAVLELAAAYYTYTHPVVGGGGGGVVTDTTLADAKNALAAIKAKLATATDAEKQALIDEALKVAFEAIAKLAQFNASSYVREVDGKAVVSLTASNLAQLFGNVEQLKASLVDAIGADNAAKLKKPTLLIDLGNVTLSSSVVNLAKDIAAKASELNFGFVAIKVSGATTKFPISAVNGDVIFTLDRTAASTAQTGGRPAVTDVFNYGLSVNGTVYDEFNEPVQIQIPLVNTTGIDTELTTVLKIDGSTQSVEGGVYGDGVLTENRYTFSSYVGVENDVTFSDVASVQSWAGREIKVVAAKGAIEGRGDGKYDPRANVTRAEFAKILVEALDLDNPNASSTKFSDVPANAWYAPAVAAAVDNGIINGRSETRFDPLAPISRAEIATMISRALQVAKGVQAVSDVDVALANFSDASTIPSSLKSGVALAASKNIVIGNEGKFSPNANASRAEAAVIVYRALNVEAE
ncbi:S-layer homology domain-containing protein [Cohnella algarum]|uniref:S-layer homology domain-containing protein n=1 Tax=Cohnella algarum TaxID=2044859 RepID=UPI0019670B49|nr:S-layer homology domain-containing protein [Cohnella algarum]MBN2980661.1 S-layer homology domain-containing protein [Cohnella algarum]